MLWLQALAVGAGGLAQVLGAVAAEVGQRGEIHPLGNLGERQAVVVEQFLEDGHGVAVDVGGDAVARHALDGRRQVLGRHVQAFGIVAHVALGAADTRGEQGHQLLDDVGGAVGMPVGGFALGMCLKDVIHHRQAQAAHQLVVELLVSVFHAFPQAVKILQQMAGLFIGERDDGILIQRDAAADTVVVSGQQVLQELVVGGKPLDLHLGWCSQVLDSVRHGDDHQVVFHDVITPLVEHKTALARQAQQVHAGVAQLRGVHPVEIVGILEI